MAQASCCGGPVDTHDVNTASSVFVDIAAPHVAKPAPKQTSSLPDLAVIRNERQLQANAHPQILLASSGLSVQG